MILRFLTILTLFGASFPLLAQVNTAERVEDSYIRTVQINPTAPYPVVELKGGVVKLTFDHIGDVLQNYIYTIVHCNSDWEPSELQDNEYIDGFTEDRVTNIEISINTLVDYTAYQISIPNQNMRFTRSGNYALIVMDDDDDRRVVMVRRFMVSENQWKLKPQMATVSNAGKIFTHQEVDFFVQHDNFNIGNPEREVKAFIYQNMRPDRIIGPVSPRPFSGSGNSLNFDYQDSIVFAAGKDFRFFDIRTFDYRGAGVRKTERNSYTWQVYLKPEQDRYESRGYGLVNDLNGRYSIENKTIGQGPLQSEYANVQFLLERNQPYEEMDVYVYGELTDWQLKPEFKMEYNEPSHSYFCTPLLKQGYYNYMFLVVDPETYQPVKGEDLEGNWHETGNRYTIMVYYRPFGGNYDRLMIVGGVDSKVE